MVNKQKPPKRPETHDKRPGMGTVAEMWKYRLAQRVRGLRLLRDYPDGISQHELSRRMNVSHSTIRRIEAGKGCTTETLVELSRFFGVSTDFLLGRAKVPEAYHELVDRTHEKIMSVASALDFVQEQGNEITIQAMLDYRDMLRRVSREFVAMAYQFRYPDQTNINVRIPYGYEFVELMEAKMGEEIDQ